MLQGAAMIRLNKMTDYGTVLLSAMASNYADNPMRLHSSVELAQQAGLTQTTTQKILKELAGSDLFTLNAENLAAIGCFGHRLIYLSLISSKCWKARLL